MAKKAKTAPAPERTRAGKSVEQRISDLKSKLSADEVKDAANVVTEHSYDIVHLAYLTHPDRSKVVLGPSLNQSDQRAYDLVKQLQGEKAAEKFKEELLRVKAKK